jgi:hypothetical protein
MKKIALLIFSSLIIGSCIREIKFDADPDAPGNIIISGEFTNSVSGNRVFIWRSNAFGSSGFVPVINATVYVVDENGNKAEYLPKTAQTVVDPEYYYELPAGAMIAEEGKPYYLEVQLSGSKTVYRSRPAVMPAMVRADSLSAKGILYNPGNSGSQGNTEPYVTLSIHTTLGPNKAQYLKWDIFRVFHFQQFFGDPIPPKTQTYCFVTDYFNQQNVMIQKFENKAGTSFSTPIATRNIDRTFEVLNYFTATQKTITADAFRYWEQIDLVANPKGTIFDPPPSEVRGNLYNVNNEVEIPLGYFDVAAVDTVRKRLVTTDLGSLFAAPKYCEYGPPNYQSPGEECSCCLLLPFSQYKKPHYWRE